MAAGTGSEVTNSLLSACFVPPLITYESNPENWSPVRFEKPGIRPLPSLMVAATSAADIRSEIFRSEGISGGEPAMVSPWQTAHWLIYKAFGLFSAFSAGEFSARAPVHARSFALT